MSDLKSKWEKLIRFMENYVREDVIIAFSGGVDSSLLLKTACDLACKNNKKIYAVTLHTKLHPVGDLTVSGKVAEELGAIHIVLEVDELEKAGIENNPVNRCYLCKKNMFQAVIAKAEELKVPSILEGTNTDDLLEYRPGIQALKELGIISPMVMAGLSKADIRELAKEYGISVADRPSAPCLATRFPYNTGLCYEDMRKVEQAENHIREMGFYNVRVRVHDSIARIEVDQSDIWRLCEGREKLITYMKELGFQYVTADLEGFRSGSMDIKQKEEN